jgi:energy-coupling factor transport system ATP-binding protein
MPFLEVKDFSFKYDDNYVLKDINFEINKGEFVLMCGPSGSGKTTLLNNIKKELKPSGESSGQIIFDNIAIEDIDKKQSACDIGLIFQNPDAQIVTDTVIQEIAFPLENIGLPTEEIRNRIAEMSTFFGIDKILHENVNNLSGGQKQLVNLCSILVLKPKLLLLDEPTSQLDPIAAYDFLSILRRLNEEFSITIIITEHKLDNVFPFANKVMYLQDGRLKYINDSRNICNDIKNDEVFKYYMPDVAKINLLLKNKYDSFNEVPVALSVREGMQLLNNMEDVINEIPLQSISKVEEKNTEELLNVKNLWFGYDKEKIILNGIDFKVKKGEYLTIIGGNGSGKSTLLKLLAGLIKPIKGKVKYVKNSKISYIHQNPMIQFSEDSVLKELSNIRESKIETDFNINPFKKSKKEEVKTDNEIVLSDYAEELVDYFDIKKLLNNHPYDCSGGEQQKIAFIKALLEKPDIMILDEPTKGLDPISNNKLSKLLKKVNDEGITIIMTTHDLSFVADNVERCVMIFDGSLQLDTTPTQIFSSNNFYTTFVNRMVKNYLPKAISIKDVKKQWNL